MGKLLFAMTSLIFVATVVVTPVRSDTAPQVDTKRIVTVPIADAPTYAKRALVIGINGYENVPKLTACANDAQHFAAFLRTKMGFQSVTVMTDEATTPDAMRPTGAHLKRQINLLLDGIVGGQTQLVLFYSGHGIRTQSAQDGDADWLVPLDADPSDIAGTCVNYSTFKSRLDTKQPARALLVMDACRNILQGKAAVGESGFGGKYLDLGPQVAELLSCQPTQTSLEGDPRDFTESVFTHFLLRGLGGDPDAIAPGGNFVTFDSLKLYVQGQVSEYAQTRIHSSQVPDGRATLGSMVLAKYSPGQRPAPTPVFMPDPVPTPQPVAPPTPTPVPAPKPVANNLNRPLYSTMVPKTWRQDFSGTMGTDVILRAPVDNDFQANITVIIRNGMSGHQLSEYSAQYNYFMSNSVPKWKLVSTKNLEVAGLKAIKFTGEYYMQQLDDNAHVEETFVINGDRSYDITFTALASNYPNYLPTYQALLTSLQFNDN